MPFELTKDLHIVQDVTAVNDVKPDIIREAIATPKRVPVNRKPRMGRNPATGQEIKILAKRVVKFRVAKAAKDAILGAK